MCVLPRKWCSQKCLKAHRIYCSLYIFTKLKCFEIVKGKCNLVMTEIFLVKDLSFIFSLTVATMFSSCSRIPFKTLGGYWTEFLCGKGKSNKSDLYINYRSFCWCSFPSLISDLCELVTFCVLEGFWTQLKNLILSYPQRLVISLIENIVHRKYSKVPRSANLATACDSEPPPHPKWVNRFDVNMNVTNLLVIFWVFMFLLCVFGEY